MKKKFLSLTIFFVAYLTSFAQVITFEKTYGGSFSDYGYSAQQTIDGGIIIAGAMSVTSGVYDAYLLKTDNQGNLQWNKSLTWGGMQDYCYSVQQTNDKGFIMAGMTGSSGTNTEEGYVIKTDSTGTPQWSKTFGGSVADYGKSVQQSQDGGYIVLGYTGSFGSGAVDAYMLKLDSTGALQWSKTYGAGNDDWGLNAQETNDGGYVLVGLASYIGTASADVYLIKTNNNGDTLWTKTYGGNFFDAGSFVQQTSDNGFIITGRTLSFGKGTHDVYLLKTDSNGTLLWSRVFGGTNYEYGNCVKQTLDGGFIVVGTTASFGKGQDDVYLIKTDQNGIMQWSKTFGGIYSDFGESVFQTSDSGFVITGTTVSFGISTDVYLIKTDKYGNSFCNDTSAATFADTATTYVGFGGLITNPATVFNSATYTANNNGTSNILCCYVPQPTVTLNGSTSFCQGDSRILTSSSALSYQWSTGETSQSITVTASGNYNVTITDVNSCKNYSSPVSIQVNSLPPTPSIATNSGSTTFCIGDSLLLTASGCLSCNYLWNSGTTTQSLYVKTTGTFSIEITDSNGCKNSNAIFITASQASVFLGNDTNICQGNNLFLDAGTGFSSYNWSTGETTQTISVNSQGTYSAAVTNLNGCQDSDSISITVNNCIVSVNLEKNFGGLYGDYGSSIIQDYDGNYVIAGRTSSFTIDQDVYLIKTDTNGDTLWTKNFGGIYADWANEVIQVSDSGYVMVGSTYSFGTGGNGYYNVYLIKTDKNGNLLWSKYYGKSYDDIGYSVISTSDGGYAISGSTNNFGNSVQGYLIKTDSIGNLLWENAFGGIYYDWGGYSLVETFDGSFVIVGYSNSFSPNNGTYDVYLAKINKYGSLVLDKTYGTFTNDYGYDIVQNSDSGFTIASKTDFGNNVYLIRINASLDTLWTKIYYENIVENELSIAHTNTGGYIITGYLNKANSDRDVYLLCTDPNGNMLWSRTFGGASFDKGYSVIQDKMGQYVITGYTKSFGPGIPSYSNVYLIITNGCNTSSLNIGKDTTICTDSSLTLNAGNSYTSYYWPQSGDTTKTISVSVPSTYFVIVTDSNNCKYMDSIKVTNKICSPNSTQVTFGGTNCDEAFSIVQTNDGGYAVAGRTASFGAGDYDMYLIKTDSNLNAVWDKTFGGANFDEARSIVQTSDNGYIICGSTESYGVNAPISNIYLIKTNSMGDTAWTKTYGGNYYDAGYSVFQTSEGGYILTGTIDNFVTNGDIYFIKINANGDSLWTRIFNGINNGFDKGNSIIQTNDGGFVVAASSTNSVGMQECLLIKIDSSGNNLWSKYFSAGTSYTGAYSVVQTSDGGYTIGSYLYNTVTNYDVYLIHTDSLGNLLWDKTITPSGYDIGYNLSKVNDGYVITGLTYSYGINGDVYLVKIDSTNEKVWFKTFGGTEQDFGNCIIQSKDGEFVIAGTTLSYGNGSCDVYLIKTNDCVAPPANLGQDTSFCPGDSLVLNPGNGFNKYEWTFGYTTNNITVKLADSYYVKVTDNNSCLSTDTVNVTIKICDGTQYQNTYGGKHYDIGNSVIATRDGGYAITGIIQNNLTATNNVGLIKTDSALNILWEKTYGNTEGEGTSIIETQDGGYIITGKMYNYLTSSNEIFLIKTNAIGDTIWSKKYINSYYIFGNIANAVIQDADGGYVIVGSTYNAQGNTDVYLLKTDTTGNKTWDKTFGGNKFNEGTSISQTKDGGYIITGSTNSFSSTSYYDVFLIKTDDDGNAQWMRSIGGSDEDKGNAVKQTSDNGYIITGLTTNLYSGDVYLIKTDANGNAEWTKSFGGIQYEIGYDIVLSSDGGYVITGSTNSSGKGYDDVYLIKTDSKGNLLWTKTFGGTNVDNGKSLVNAHDCGYVITGATSSFGAGYFDIYMIRTDGYGNLTDAIPPFINLGNDTTICAGQTVLLDAGSGFDNYAWSNNETTQAISVTMPENYYVNVTANNGCQSIDSIKVLVEICLGINNNIYMNNDVLIYPNPFNTSATITIHDDSFTKGELIIYDVLGNVVRQISITNSTIEIQKENINSGVYLFELRNEKEVLSRGKFVVN